MSLRDGRRFKGRVTIPGAFLFTGRAWTPDADMAIKKLARSTENERPSCMIAVFLPGNIRLRVESEENESE
jgi:hypothetical protein